MANSNKLISLPEPSKPITVAQTPDGVMLDIHGNVILSLSKQTLASLMLTIRVYMLTVEGMSAEDFIAVNAPADLPMMSEVGGERKTYTITFDDGDVPDDAEIIESITKNKV